MFNKEVFCKIIELKYHQVLVAKSVDEDGLFTINITIFLDGMEISISPTYTDEDERDKHFDLVDGKKAMSTVDSMLSMFEEETMYGDGNE